MERWERREQKRRAEAARMPKTGMSVRLIAQILAERAAAARAQTDAPPAPSGRDKRSGKRRH
jgi:transposase-like protein